MTASERELLVAIGNAVFSLIAAMQTKYYEVMPARDEVAIKMGMDAAREALVAALGSVKREIP